MKIAVISDLHANLEALLALPRDYDELWVLGDLVNYGPNPAETIEFVRRHASVVVRGNHDHSVGFDADCRCAPRFRAMAEETGRFTSSVLGARDKQFLRDLPAVARREVDGKRFLLCHATPSDPLYEYRPPDSPLWAQDADPCTGADVLLVGHTHVQFASKPGRRMVINPGSLGQSKSGDPRARYAVWQDGEIFLCTLDYPVETTVAKINSLPLSENVAAELAGILRTGRVPETS